MNIYIASNNEGKIKEISSQFTGSNIYSQTDIEKIINRKLDIEEDGKTFTQNAIIKAKVIEKALKNLIKKNDLIMADDSGIVIPSLPDMLGVNTKREMITWCKQQSYNATEKNFYNYITSITRPPKTCIFEIVIATIQNNICKTFSSKLEGTLADTCRGDNGFGFDPIFEINGKTLAEMTDNEKSYINPRAKAIQKMKNTLLN